MNSLSRLLLMMCAYLLMGSGIAQAQYTTLGVPGASFTAAFGISGNNIVGYYVDSEGTHGFLYDGSRYTTPYVPGSFETIVEGIEGNNIVGFYDNGEGTYSDRGFLYDGNHYTTLDVPGAFRTLVYGISGNNIVGQYVDSEGTHGFLYDGSHYTSLDVPGSFITVAAGISGNNIVGQYVDSVGSHGFLYDGNHYTTLDVPGASFTSAFGISGNNIVGVYVDGEGTHGFLFKPIALSLSNITATATGPSSALVSWTTSTSASSVVEYGETATYGYAVQDSNLVTNHSLSLSSLLPNTQYHYRVKSTDANGITITSTDGTFVTQTVPYSVRSLYDQSKAHQSGSTIPIKIEVDDSSGANLSSSSLVVQARSVIQVSTNAPGALEYSGDANPDFDFRYTGGAYLFNLKTTGYPTGTYTLNFSIGTDTRLYSVQFQVK